MRIAIAVLCTAGIASAQGGTPPGGTPPGGTTTTVTYNATYTLNGGTATQSNQTYSATATDTSGVWVTNSGVLTLSNPIITTSGNTSSTDSSSFAGLNAGLLVTSGSATVTGGTITTGGTGANGAFAYNTGSTVSLTNTTINATGDGGHAVMATGGATLTTSNVNMTTTGGSSSAVATDRGGGTITVNGGIVTTGGNNSADIYSTGNISVTGATMKSTGAEAAVIEGANSITLNNSNLTCTKEKWAVMIYQSMSGDAGGNQGAFTMTGGSLAYTPTSGPLFYVNNTTAIVNLKGVTLSAASGVLVSAAAGAWGNSGSNGGNVVLTADGQTLAGDMIADSISTIALTLKNNSTLTGKLTKASVTLDAASLWSVTGNSMLTSLTDSAGISGTSIANIKGNGFTVTYDSSLSANSYLAGKTYSLAGGGTLTPAGTSAAGSAPAIAAAGVMNAASGVAGVAPGAWISIYGSNLSTAAGAATADLVNGYLPTTFGGTTVTIDGKSAYLNYVSPAQLNVQAPDFSTAGNVTVTVANSAGASTASVAAQAVMPGLFTSSNYVLAVRPGDSVIINGTGAAVIGYTTAAAAKAGDVLEIFATGLGATTTAVAPGLVFSGAYATTDMPAVNIGGKPATVMYSGLIGAGLYQINLTVPVGLAAGTYPVVVTQSGSSSPSTALLKIVAD
jgi:uncharacterized protein (TIGR03437 family)